MNINAAFPSKYLRAADLEGVDTPFTITEVTIEIIGDDDEHKPVAWFSETEAGWVLNKTNANLIQEVLGTAETEDWKGREITLYPTRVQFGSKMVDAIRVRVPVRPPAARRTNGGVDWTAFHSQRKAAGLSLDEVFEMCGGQEPRELAEKDLPALMAVWKQFKAESE